jgi:hypothetical protein
LKVAGVMKEGRIKTTNPAQNAITGFGARVDEREL